MWHITCERTQVTGDTQGLWILFQNCRSLAFIRLMTCYTQEVVNILSKCQVTSYNGLRVKMFGKLLGKGWLNAMNEWIKNPWLNWVCYLPKVSLRNFLWAWMCSFEFADNKNIYQKEHNKLKTMQSIFSRACFPIE